MTDYLNDISLYVLGTVVGLTIVPLDPLLRYSVLVLLGTWLYALYYSILLTNARTTPL